MVPVFSLLLSVLTCFWQQDLPLRLNVQQWFSRAFNLQPEPLSGIWINKWMCHNPFVCFPFRGLCVHSSPFQVLRGGKNEIPSSNKDIWSPACSSMFAVAHFPRLQCVEDLIITPFFPLSPLAFFGGGWRNSGNSFHWPHQTLQSHGILFRPVLLLNKALDFQRGKRKRMRGRAQEWNTRKSRRTSGPFLAYIDKGGGVGSHILSTLHCVARKKKSENTASPGNPTCIPPEDYNTK